MTTKGEEPFKRSAKSTVKGQKALSVAFLWHMHQPYYKDTRTNRYQMPWVRLHGLKDYYDMVAVLEEFPQIHQTFNLVPSLVEQIQDYAENQVYDEHLLLTERPASDLTDAEKVKMLSSFFSCNPATMIHPYPRYRQLMDKKGNDLPGVKSKILDFQTQDFLDLQVWSNLVWIDPIFRGDALISRLMKKGENFTEEEKTELILKQREIMGRILPQYKIMQEKGQIEVSFSPYFHPIMPLLCDTNQAQIALPHIQLPENRFSHPEDVEAQIDWGIKLYERIFGKKPNGMWPPEGSVSETIVPLVAKSGIKWIATDEEILYLSLLMKKGEDGKGPRRGSSPLYKTYQIEAGNEKLSILFRDHTLSDLIGFVYSSWDAETAADDFVRRLHQIRNSIPEDELSSSAAVIILDGENCWEYYKNDGHDFLSALYSRLSDDKLLLTTTLSELLKTQAQPLKLPHLFPGSWINHNFRIWIGHPEDNLAWDLLSKTRNALVDFEMQKGKSDEAREILRQAWKEIYVAEGSDWNWWYGDEHQAEGIEEFDRMFRSHLLFVYELMDQDPPEELYLPIKAKFVNTYFLAPTGYVNPVIDGEKTHYYEWQQAGFYDPLKAGGTMHQTSSLISGIYFGSDDHKLYFRMDLTVSPEEFQQGNYEMVLEILEPSRYKISIKQGRASLFRKINEKEWKLVSAELEFAFSKIMELAVPTHLFEFMQKQAVQFQLIAEREGNEMERWPSVDAIKFDLPGQNKALIFWEV
ncbi:MAG TPA: glycoside hydrolase family 57 protein [candidate division Zixibacteria bacterium]